MTVQAHTIRHVIIDPLGRILEVTNMYNRFGNDTTDPALAETCVIRDGDCWWAASLDDAQVYTVH